MEGRGHSPAGDRTRRQLLMGAASAAALLLVGCQSEPETTTVERPRATRRPTPKPTPKPPAKISITPADGESKVKWSEQVKVKATDGVLRDVALTDKNGKSIEGTFDGQKTFWSAESSTLVPGMTYNVQAEAVNPDGLVTTAVHRFTTAAASKILGTDITPLDGMTVGVGMPIVVKFTASVKDRARVQERMVVEASKPVEGAWHWFSDREAHYRPKTYWPAHTDVTLRIDLEGVHGGDGAWGIKNKVKRFRIGRSVITKVNLRNYHAKVYIDGKLARTIPVTGGKPGWETRSGTKVVLERRTNIRFRNEAIAAPEEYDLVAPYGLRVTWSGEFLHTAQWSVANHGRRNGSHGCVGMNTANSKWLWKNCKVGDPVETISNGPRMPVTGNGYGDWNMSWEKWKAGSALPV